MTEADGIEQPTLRPFLSAYLVEFVRDAYRRCLDERPKVIEPYITEDNHTSQYAIEAYILSVASAEAFLNETIGIAKETRKLQGILTEWIEDLEIRKKVLLVPVLLWNRTFDRGSDPFQSFDVLVRLRNDCVHYKWSSSLIRGTAYLRDLESKGVLLPGKAGFKFYSLMTAKGALWAHNTVCRLVNRAAELGEYDRRIFGLRYEAFKEISANYWREYMETRNVEALAKEIVDHAIPPAKST